MRDKYLGVPIDTGSYVHRVVHGERGAVGFFRGTPELYGHYDTVGLEVHQRAIHNRQRTYRLESEVIDFSAVDGG